ncbi:GIY-YIG nuclease family protein [Gaoshiqia sediminis]|uniref:GIY-YIG nuclease family protein n=1 Tax=Gaoshiqia sediminis TaxID=2986998 RepID=UPI003D0A2C26
MVTEDIPKENIIYCLIFPSGKKYIGKTERILENRIKQHISEAFNKSGNYYDTKKARAIRKYMEFSVSILYEGDDLNTQEKY